MKKKLLSFLLILTFTSATIKLRAQNPESQRIQAEAATSSSYHATALSMVIWGVLIAGGIAAIVLLNHSHSD